MKYTEFNHREYESHMLVYNLIKPLSKVLDLGCATGYFAKELKKKHCHVTGVDVNKEAVVEARTWCVKTYQGDLERATALPIPKNTYDYVLLLDVLEHLNNRQTLLEQIRQWIADDGRLIISTPNIAHISIRLKLLFGDFTYSDYGILDETHVYFFTKQTLMKLLHASGWEIERCMVSADFGQMPIIGRLLRHIPKRIQHIVSHVFPNLLGVQFIVSCKTNSSLYG